GRRRQTPRPGSKGRFAGLTRIPPRHLEGWSELAAAGQAATLVSRALQPLVADVKEHLKGLRGTMNGNGTPASRKVLRRLDALIADLRDQLDAVVEMHPEIITSRRTIDIGSELERTHTMLRPLLASAGIKMDVAVRGARLLRAEIRAETFHHLICILTRNSLE